MHSKSESHLPVIKITSSAFKSNASIPTQYTCEGININPPIDIADIPKTAKSLALIVDDPDARKDTWVHWVLWNIPVTNSIKENSVQGIQGNNDFGKQNYGGPCPPSGTHRYFFKVYALDRMLNISDKSDKAKLEAAMKGHTIGYGELIGLYQKKNK